MPALYFDHHTTSPLFPEVREAMLPCLQERFGSASSLHGLGLEARDGLDAARKQIAAVLHAASDEEILFTSGGTESANLAIKGAAWAALGGKNHLVHAATDHPSIVQSATFLAEIGFQITELPVDRQGFVDRQRFADALTPQTFLACVHLANHDLGTIQPVADLCRIAQEKQVPVFCDAVSATGWLELDVGALGCSLLSLSTHRVGGPVGAGALYIRRGTKLKPLLHGGVQEHGLRAGTENIASIVGMAKALEIAASESPSRATATRLLQQQLWKELQNRIPGAHLHGPEPGPLRSPQSLNLSFEGVEGEAIALACDMKGLQLSSGAACVNRALRIPPALKAIGVPHDLGMGNILIGFGPRTNATETTKAAELLVGVVEKLRRMSPSWGKSG